MGGGGRGRSLKEEGALEQVVNQESIFHIKGEPDQVLQDQAVSRLAAYPDAGGYNFHFSWCDSEVHAFQG